MSSPLRRRTTDLAVVEAEDRISVLDLAALERPPVILEGTAMEIWRLLDGGLDESGLVATLASAYGVGDGAVEADVSAFLKTMSDLDLLEAVPHE